MKIFKQKKCILSVMTAILSLLLSTGSACAQSSTNSSDSMYKIVMTVNGHTLYATLYDNATTRAFVEKLPLTLSMMDLYDREMCYRFPDALPTDNVSTTGYEVGEIVYYPPMHSFVIMYAQNGERFSMQKLGMMDSDVSFFNGIGDVDVYFELDASSLSEISQDHVTVKTSGNKVVVDADGSISAALYSMNGKLIGKSSGSRHLELAAADHRGPAILNLTINGHKDTRKIIQ